MSVWEKLFLFYPVFIVLVFQSHPSAPGKLLRQWLWWSHTQASISSPGSASGSGVCVCVCSDPGFGDVANPGRQDVPAAGSLSPRSHYHFLNQRGRGGDLMRRGFSRHTDDRKVLASPTDLLLLIHESPPHWNVLRDRVGGTHGRHYNVPFCCCVGLLWQYGSGVTGSILQSQYSGWRADDGETGIRWIATFFTALRMYQVCWWKTRRSEKDDFVLFI